MERSAMAAAKIRAALPDAVEGVSEFRGETTILVPQTAVVEVCRFLRDDAELRYIFLSDIVADDMMPEFPRFALNYHLYSLANSHGLRVRTLVEDPEEGPETLTELWQVASWLEMEVWDLMGIRFAGNGALRRLFLPEDWTGHPLRKDYPLGYEEVQFSFNWEAIDAKKPYAQE